MHSQTARLSEYLVTFWARIWLFTKCKNVIRHSHSRQIGKYSKWSTLEMSLIFTFCEKSYPCSKCDKVFWQWGSLRTHELFTLVKSHIEWECLITFLHLVKSHVLAQNVTRYSDNRVVGEHIMFTLVKSHILLNVRQWLFAKLLRCQNTLSHFEQGYDLSPNVKMW